MANYDEKGRQIPDTTPVAVPLAYRGGQTMEDRLRMFIRAQLSQHAAEAGHETFEEASDFDVPDEEELILSPYEIPEGQPDGPGGIPEADPAPPDPAPAPPAPAPAPPSPLTTEAPRST